MWLKGSYGENTMFTGENIGDTWLNVQYKTYSDMDEQKYISGLEEVHYRV